MKEPSLQVPSVAPPLTDTDKSSALLPPSISALQSLYSDGDLTPRQLMQTLRQRAESFADYNIWIHLLSETEQAPYLDRLQQLDPASAPLWGIPFAIKDNIDLAGIPTTAACPAFSTTPKHSATVVQRLIDAGAIPVGKTNLDQFATGLNGTRSPYGACANAYQPNYISGGSSSGSAVALAMGMVSFSLGTDTAGSGRIPAAFNQLIGVKPSRGLLSSYGMLPACRSLDTMSIFARNCDDANQLLAIAEGVDYSDPYSRRNTFSNSSRQYGERGGPLRIALLGESDLCFFGDQSYADAYHETLQTLREAGADIEWQTIDYTPFRRAAELLYAGPWLSERYIATSPLIADQAEAMHPVVRGIISEGSKPSAIDTFEAMYRLQTLKAECDRALAPFDCLLTPTAGRCYTIDEMQREPVQFNSELGYYTNFMNLLDYAAVAMPGQQTKNGLPFGISLASLAFQDRALLSIARRFEQALLGRTNAPSKTVQAIGNNRYIDLLVCGAHLQDLPLNWQLSERGAWLVERTQTAPCYRLYALAGGPPARPGLILDPNNGRSIEAEIWRIPSSEFGSFVAAIPSPLGIGKVTLANGQQVCGFICEANGIDGATDISHYGGWRTYLEQA